MASRARWARTHIRHRRGGLVSTSTRTVIIEAPSIASTDDASTTEVIVLSTGRPDVLQFNEFNLFPSQQTEFLSQQTKQRFSPGLGGGGARKLFESLYVLVVDKSVHIHGFLFLAMGWRAPGQRRVRERQPRETRGAQCRKAAGIEPGCLFILIALADDHCCRLPVVVRIALLVRNRSGPIVRRRVIRSARNVSATLCLCGNRRNYGSNKGRCQRYDSEGRQRHFQVRVHVQFPSMFD
jgi:hypothetical protein